MSYRLTTKCRKSGTSVIMTLPKSLLVNLNMMDKMDIEILVDQNPDDPNHGKFTCYPCYPVNMVKNEPPADEPENSGAFEIG